MIIFFHDKNVNIKKLFLMFKLKNFNSQNLTMFDEDIEINKVC